MNNPSLKERTSPEVDIARMDRETNLDSILALDAEIIRLKRTRNSLLNVARMPPEILGYIFLFNITTITKSDSPHFTEIQKGSYNFLLVCHHWLQVALRTPELWSFWGNSPKDWKRWYLRSGTSTLDLTLDWWGYEDGSFDGVLRDALRDRAARDVIRKVHLRSDNTELLTAIVSSLIPEGEGIRHSSIESIVLSKVDVSNLFARHHFSRLRNVCLSGCFKISSWDYLKPTTTTLSNLSLDFTDVDPTSPVPTASQILSLLTSSPNIRSLTLTALAIDDDSGDGHRFHLPLRYLEHLSLTGAFHHVFPILHRLELPARMHKGEVTFLNCTSREVADVIGPYIGGYLRRDAGFGDRLGIFVTSTSHCISFHASVIGVGYQGPDQLPQHGPPYARFRAILSQPILHDAGRRLCTDILALLPQERIVNFETDLQVTEDIIAAMPNLESLYLVSPVVPRRFLLPRPGGPNRHRKLLPSLRRLYLEDAEAENENWEPLIAYLAYQTSGDQTVSLKLFGEGVHICPRVIKQIEGLVEEFIYQPDPYEECPFDECL